MENNNNSNEVKARPYINPYLGGVLLGIVLLSAYFFSGEGLGASGAFKSGISTLVVAVSPGNVDNQSFFGKTYNDLKENPKKRWIVFQVLGVLIGGFISGVISKRLKIKVEHSPKITNKRRLAFAFGGGIFFGLGAQFARGCTSGAALSGMATISVAGFLTMICIFGTGYMLAYFFRKNWI